MTIKPIKQKTFNDLLKLSDDKLNRRIEWLNHTGHCEAFEDSGRLYYRVKVTIGRNMAEIKEFSIMLAADGKKVLEVKN